MGSYQLNGTYSSATSIWLWGSVMRAWAYTSWAQSTPAWGRTPSRPGNHPSSLRTAVAGIHPDLGPVLRHTLGAERCAHIRLVSADAMEWIGEMVADRCGNATLCLDAYHVVAWATAALDQVRRQVWNDARRSDIKGHAAELKRLPLRAVEEPRRPHRPPDGEAGMDRSNQQPPLPGLSAQMPDKNNSGRSSPSRASERW